MRKVKFKVYPAINNSTTFEGEGLFHCWGSSFTEFETGAGNFTIAIVEDKNGNIWNVNSEDLQFLDPPDDETHIQGSNEEVVVNFQPFYPELYKDTLIDEGRLIPVDVIKKILKSKNTITSGNAFAVIKGNAFAVIKELKELIDGK